MIDRALLTRRALLRGATLTSLASAGGLLTACGGGGDDGAAADAPQLLTERPTYLVGEQAKLQAKFGGEGTATIEPGIGTVRDGEIVTTPPLAQSSTYRLTVRSPGRPDRVREVRVPVGFRDRWVMLEQHFPVAHHASVSMPDGSVLVFGGSRYEPTLSFSVDRFDPVTRRFTPAGTMLNGRGGHTATLMADGKVLLVGGALALNDSSEWELFDPALGRSVASGPMIQPRHQHAAVRLADGRVLVTGGSGRNTGEVFDPATRHWRLLVWALHNHREGHTLTRLPDGKVLIAGGHTEDIQYDFAELFDPQTEALTTIASNVADRRLLHHAHVDGAGRVVLIGGEFENVGGSIEPMATVLRFDPGTRQFATVASLDRGRTLFTSVALPDDTVLLLGGQTNSDIATRDALAWSPAGVRALAPLPHALTWATAHRLLDGRVLVIGGDDGVGLLRPNALIYE